MAQTLESTDVTGVHGMVVLNPDGTAIGTPVGGATSDNQTNGSQKTQIVDAGGEAVTITGFATSAKQDTTNANLQALNSLAPTTYDYISLSYTGDNLTGVIYKLGGSGGTTVSTLTLGYTGANLTSVNKT